MGIWIGIRINGDYGRRSREQAFLYKTFPDDEARQDKWRCAYIVKVRNQECFLFHFFFCQRDLYCWQNHGTTAFCRH